MNATLLGIGQRIHCILYGGRDGIVYAVHGEQSPDSIRTLGGVVATGGRAMFDIVFEDGTISRMVPECIVHGVQWRIYDETATAEEIAEALRFAEVEGARKKAEALATAERRAKERQEHAAKYTGLVKKADKPQWSKGRVAAENIRRELKRDFPGVKFSVQSDYNSVDVRWTDGPTSEQVEAVTRRYKAESFNGMEDIYESNLDATFADVFGDPDYVSCSRTDTVQGVRRAWELAGFNPAEVPADWEEGGRWKMADQNIGTHMLMAWGKTDLR